MEVEQEHIKTFRETLRRWVGKDKPYTVKQLSELSGVSERNIRAFMDHTGPNFGKAAQIIAVMPPAFAVQAFARAGVTYLEKSEPSVAICSRRLNTLLSQTNTRLTEMHEDGLVDHMEEAELDQMLPVLRDNITRFLTRKSKKYLTLVKTGHSGASEPRVP